MSDLKTRGALERWTIYWSYPEINAQNLIMIKKPNSFLVSEWIVCLRCRKLY